MPEGLVLHLGAAKTGSSAIQGFLRRNRAALGRRGFAVPGRELDLDGPATGEHVWGLQRFLGPGDEAGLVDALDALRRSLPPGQAAVLSAENLSNLGGHRLFRRVAEAGPTRAILYIRRQDELLTSAWQQWHCKTEADLHAWLFKALRTYGLWERLIGDWEGVLGEGRVEVRLFERVSLRDGDVVRDFVDALGCGPAEGLELGAEDVNPSLSDVVTDLVTGHRSLFRDIHDNDYFNWVLARTGSAWTASGGPGPGARRRNVSLLTREQRDSLLGFYRDMNERVRARFFPDRASLFAPIEHGAYDYLDREALRDRQLRFLNELVFASRPEAQKGGRG